MGLFSKKNKKPEDALIGPGRPVLDVCMGEYAAGKRQ